MRITDLDTNENTYIFPSKIHQKMIKKNGLVCVVVHLQNEHVRYTNVQIDIQTGKHIIEY